MIERVSVPARPGLDEVSAYFEDLGGGAGRVILVCWDMAYTAYWGAMGDRTVKQFFAGCGVDYITGRMSGRHYKQGKIDQHNLDRVVKAVHDHLNLKQEAA